MFKISNRDARWLSLLAELALLAACDAPAVGTQPDEKAPDVASSQVEALFKSTAAKWNDLMCLGNEECFLADVDGDGLADAIAVDHANDDVWLALSEGSSFKARVKVLDSNGCKVGETCMFGDVTGDRRADMVVVSNAGTTTWVLGSTGIGFNPRAPWSTSTTCKISAGETCKLADVNGDRLADIVAFVKDSQPEPARGDVYVTRAGNGRFAPREFWQDWFCIGQEICDVGDFNADGNADVVTFLRSSVTGAGEGDVYIALSNKAAFVSPSIWSSWFCVGNQECKTADIDNDGRSDLVAFTKSAATDQGQGDVWVGLSTGSAATGIKPGEKWHESFCVANGEVCALGDVDALSGGADAVAFKRDTVTDTTRGDVSVVLSDTLLCEKAGENQTCSLGTWPNGIVYYAWDTALTQAQLSALQPVVSAAMTRWENASAHAVRFQPSVIAVPRLTIGSSCGKPVSEAKGFNSCNAQPWNPANCTMFVCGAEVDHELGHVLGLMHHHQRYDRDHYLRMNRFPGCDEVSQMGRCTQAYRSEFGPFDYKSTMLYGPHDPNITRWDQSPVCTLREKTTNHTPSPNINNCASPDGPNKQVTAGDGATVAELYLTSLSGRGWSRFWRAMNTEEPIPYDANNIPNKAPYDERLTSTVRIARDASPAVETWEGGSLAMYLRGTDSKLYKKFLQTSTNQWSTTWEALGAPTGVSSLSDPAVVSWAPGRTDVVVRGDTSIFIKSTPTWSAAWQSLGGPAGGAASAPAITSFGPNHLAVFVRATDGRIYHKRCTANCSGSAGTWSTWDPIGADTFRSKPGVVSRSNGNIDLFAQKTDGAVWQARFTGAWGSWNKLAGTTLAFDATCPDCFGPAAGSRSANSVDLYVRGLDSKLWVANWNGSVWGAFTTQGGVLSGSPATIARVRATDRADVIVTMLEGRKGVDSPGTLPMEVTTWWKTYVP